MTVEAEALVGTAVAEAPSVVVRPVAALKVEAKLLVGRLEIAV